MSFYFLKENSPLSIKRMKWNDIFFLFTFLLVGLLLSCNAPRTNPLDPNNPNNTLHSIRGTVFSDAHLPLPLEEVTVLWKENNTAVQSNDSGIFHLTLLSPQNGWLMFEKNGYTKDSAFVKWSGKKEFLMGKHLNAIPVLDSVIMFSEVRNKYNSPAEYSLETSVTLTDDDEIDTVFLLNEELNILKPLNKISATTFSGKFSDYQLQLGSLVEIIGREFSFHAHERQGVTYRIGSATVKRIIELEVETFSPKNLDTIFTTTPVLNWIPYTPGFRFTFFVEVYEVFVDEFQEPALVWSKNNISSDSISVTTSTNIIPGASTEKYFWVIGCVDEFQNRNRSKPASFIIVP
ncbi:MAG: carboxypeptidase regulatory-like domain-containing protein [Ignavibacteriales bacterium]|nr:carboxypeptidase regulatory-like domain-containing protein [Ignavibacteriales bacterium]